MENNLHPLQKLDQIRTIAQQIFDLTLKDQGLFTLNLTVLDKIHTDLKQFIDKRYTSYDQIPPHARLSHVPKSLQSRIPHQNDLEKTKAFLDFIIISVILDAGAGNTWTFKRENYESGRSEGIALAAFFMFEDACFSKNKFQVDQEGLSQLTLDTFKQGFQITEDNMIPQVEKRFEMIHKLASQLENKTIFKTGRPSDFIDDLMNDQKDTIDFNLLWERLIKSFGPIWPQRNEYEGVFLGDAWTSQLLNNSIVPFHKLQQWLAYSIIEPIEKFLNKKVINREKMTGLPEYRNGGLFIDYGVITPKNTIKPIYQVNDELIIQWRALTVILLDKVADRFKKEIPVDTLPKVLEAGTWALGRQIAAELRPQTKGPPINISSDGTVF